MGTVENTSHSETILSNPKQTPNRRNRLRRLLKVIVALVVVVALFVSYLYIDQEYGNRLWPKRVTELRGIELGAKRADVLFKKGAPSYTNSDAYHYYEDYNFIYIVQYSGDKVIRLHLFAKGDSESYPKVAGVSTGDYGFLLIRELGEPDSTSDTNTTSGAVRRSYHYYKLGVVFDLQMDRVVGITVD